MKKELKKIAVIMMVFFVAAAMVACGDQKGGEGKTGDELIYVDREIAQSTNPRDPDVASYYMRTGAGEALFDIAADGQVVPWLAEGIEQKDSTTWEITLRSNAKFWSGDPVTADAVIKSLDLLKEKNPKAGPPLDGLSFKSEGNYKMIVKTASENMLVALKLADMELLICNPEKAHDSVDTMDMTGMYKVVKFEPKKKLELEINENYYGDKPEIKKIINEEIGDDQARTLAATSGRADIIRRIPPESIQEIKADKDLVFYKAEAANAETIYLNIQKSKLGNVKVRQALSWGLDRKELVDLAAEGESVPVTSWLGSNPKYKDEVKDAVYNKYDPKKAGELLDEAGWKLNKDGLREKNGKVFTMKLFTWGEDKALGEGIQEQWKKIGIKTEVNHVDYSLIEEARDKNDWDALIEAWSSFGDEASMLKAQYAPNGGANYGKYDSKEVNKLFKKLEIASTEQERHELTLKINSIVLNDAPAIYVYPRLETTAVRKTLTGFEEHFIQFRNVITSKLKFEK